MRTLLRDKTLEYVLFIESGVEHPAAINLVLAFKLIYMLYMRWNLTGL